MNNKIIITLLCSSLLVVQSMAQDTLRFDLLKCIEIARENNPDLQTIQLNMQSSNVRLTQSRAAALPGVSGYLSQGLNQGKSINPYTNSFINQQIITGQYGINSNLTLWNGLSVHNTKRQSKFNYEASKLDLEQAMLDLKINVTLAYLQVLTFEEQLKLSASQLAVSKAQVERLEILQKNNAANPTLLYDTKGQYANDYINYLNTKSALETSKINLARLLNIDTPMLINVEPLKENPQAVSGSTEELYATASEKTGLVRAANYRKIAAQKGVYAAYGQLLPSLNLYASVGTNYSDAAVSQKLDRIEESISGDYVLINNNRTEVYTQNYVFRNDKIGFSTQARTNLNSYIGLTLNVPVFNAFRLKSQVSNTKINLKQNEVNETAAQKGLKLTIEQSVSNLNIAKEKYTAAEQQAGYYAESLKIAIARYETGALSSVEYMVAKNNADRAALNAVAARYDYLLKSKILAYYNGE